MLERKYEYDMWLTDIVDGDTIDVRLDLGFNIYMNERVRFFGVDTPEIFGADNDENGYWAKLYVACWLMDREYDLIKSNIEEWMAPGFDKEIFNERFQIFMAFAPVPIRHRLVSREYDHTGSFGRILGDVYRYDDGQCLTDDLIEEGFVK